MARKVKEVDADVMLGQLDSMRSEIEQLRSVNSTVGRSLDNMATQVQVLRQQINILRDGGIE